MDRYSPVHLSKEQQASIEQDIFWAIRNLNKYLADENDPFINDMKLVKDYYHLVCRELLKIIDVYIERFDKNIPILLALKQERCSEGEAIGRADEIHDQYKNKFLNCCELGEDLFEALDNYLGSGDRCTSSAAICKGIMDDCSTSSVGANFSNS